MTWVGLHHSFAQHFMMASCDDSDKSQSPYHGLGDNLSTPPATPLPFDRDMQAALNPPAAPDSAKHEPASEPPCVPSAWDEPPLESYAACSLTQVGLSAQSPAQRVLPRSLFITWPVLSPTPYLAFASSHFTTPTVYICSLPAPAQFEDPYRPESCSMLSLQCLECAWNAEVAQ